MALSNNITYQAIVNRASAYIKANCTNIANFSNVPTQMRSGYSVTQSYAGGTYKSYRTITCTRGISQVAASVVDTDLNNFMSVIGVKNIINQPIKNEEVYRFINNLASFCTSNVYIASGMFNQNTRICVYISTNNFKTKENILNVDDLNLIEIVDIETLLEALKKTVSEKARVFACQYTINLS